MNNLHSRRFAVYAGFTLIEMMVTISIVAILLGAGVPSFSSFLISQRVKSAASEISSMLNFARSEAIKRNNNVVITQAPGGWQNGWTVTTTLSGVTTTIDQHEAFSSGVAITGTASNITYSGMGRLMAAAGQSFSIRSAPPTKCVTVGITVSGMPNSKIVSC